MVLAAPSRASGTNVSDANDVDLLTGLTLDTTAAAASPLYGSAVAADRAGHVAFVLTLGPVVGTSPSMTVEIQESDQETFDNTDLALAMSTTTQGVAPVDEVQLITPGGSPSAGTYTITYSGQTTAPIAYDAVAATIQTALEALSNIAPGDVTVTGGPVSSGVVTLTFGGTLAGTNVAQVTCDAAGLIVNEVQSIAVGGGAATAGTFTITYAGQTTAGIAYDANAATITTALEALSNLAPGDVVVTGGPVSAGTALTLTFGGTLAGTNVAEVTASAAGLVRNEVQIITPGGVISGGDWTITHAGQTTAAIAWDADAAAITAALDALSNLEVGDVVATGGPVSSGVVTLTFGGALAGTNVAEVTVSAAGLTGTDPTLTPSTTVQGTTPTLTPSTTTTGKTPTLTPSTSVAGVAAVDEVQRITPTGASSNGGTFTLTYAGQTTAPIAYNATAEDIQTALVALSNIGDDEMVCAGGPVNEAFVSCTFSEGLGGGNRAAMTINTSGLTSDADVFTLATLKSTGTGEDNEVYSAAVYVTKKWVRAKVTVADGGTVDADYTSGEEDEQPTLFIRQPHWHRTEDSTAYTIV